MSSNTILANKDVSIPVTTEGTKEIKTMDYHRQVLQSKMEEKYEKTIYTSDLSSLFSLSPSPSRYTPILSPSNLVSTLSHLSLDDNTNHCNNPLCSHHSRKHNNGRSKKYLPSDVIIHEDERSCKDEEESEDSITTSPRPCTPKDSQGHMNDQGEEKIAILPLHPAGGRGGANRMNLQKQGRRITATITTTTTITTASTAKNGSSHRDVFSERQASVSHTNMLTTMRDEKRQKQYVSPSDDIMSPCTAKLSALRSKQAGK